MSAESPSGELSENGHAVTQMDNGRAGMEAPVQAILLMGNLLALKRALAQCVR
jgi:hypothetical protein